MIVEERVGDLFSHSGVAIGHGVNTQGVMGAGIAKEFRRRWPGLYEDYKQACADGYLLPGGSLLYSYPPYQFIFNLATQRYPGADARLEWISEALTAAVDYLELWRVSELAIPRIGCGIGGLNWEDVRGVIEKSKPDSDFTVVVYSLEGDA